jgi:murein L,D-transpeptidase YcbB/YkuD
MRHPRSFFISVVTASALIPLLDAAATQLTTTKEANASRTMVNEALAPAAETAVAESSQRVAHPDYGALEDLLKDYQKIAEKGGWPSFEIGETIRTEIPSEPNAPPNTQDVRDARIPTIRRILTIMGDYTYDEPREEDADAYDLGLRFAVKQFQRRHGLYDDGLIGRETQAAMNVPVEFRIQQIMATMQRIQNAPAASDRYVVVNIPEFMLRVYDRGNEVLDMKVVVGTPKDKTPQFSTTISYVSFNPPWGVPTRIAVEEMLPKIIEYPDFLSDHNYVVYEITPEGRVPVDPQTIDWPSLNKHNFPYLISQTPGDDNALGKIKFGLTKSDGIYMHDTAAKKFFGRDIRAYSHGCVRVEKPRELAHFVFEHMEKFTPERVDRFYDDTESKILRVEPLPVHFVYWTAWVGEKGRPQFRKDIYNHDKNGR